ncbi:hypothetical protein N7532_006706 [Penicillium argentinense]|uniref:Uncharacterized protein n=1 Tax=Penicillium argentinense TaxID=1131581 RepID=A0A9W9KB30_9EURO|nr:uncharacterized protein N7532_006706 [Penicillium argentinense]KAJ5099705.1 hypothetical protein N7532_006706 [Penicillium argentinense]
MSSVQGRPPQSVVAATGSDLAVPGDTSPLCVATVATEVLSRTFPSRKVQSSSPPKVSDARIDSLR